MPVRIWKRPSNGIWYLLDHGKYTTLDTKSKPLAELKRRDYELGRYNPAAVQGPTVKEYYEKWIASKQPPLVRKAQARDYKQHFSAYILPEHGPSTLQSVSLTTLQRLLATLLASSLSMKTARNILDGSFRALWRDAKREGLVSHNPFEDLDWPRLKRERPDPFSPEERQLIEAWFFQNEKFYYPYVRFQFETGCRPSETTALRWSDIDGQRIHVERSRVLDEEDDTKTSASFRTIKVSEGLIGLLNEMRVYDHIGPESASGYIFRNKISGKPLDPKGWTKVYWQRCLLGTQWARCWVHEPGQKRKQVKTELVEYTGAPSLKDQVRYRSAYKMRHTAITELIKGGNEPLAVARYVGTSLEMIQRNYCGELEVDLAPRAVEVA